MSTEIITAMKDHTLVEFWGGDRRGLCAQVTATKIPIEDSVLHQLQVEGFITLTLDEACELISALTGFIKREATRRQRTKKI
jgi:hypothetical protein